MSSESALSLWKSQVPCYERIINRCLNRILTPLTRFPPPFFLQKIQEFKEILSTHEPSDCFEYIDVIGHHVQGVKNMSIMQIADMMIRQFGGTIGYWQNAILDVGEQTSYTNEVSIWHVRKVYEGKLYIDAENLSNYRSLCKLTKPYLASLINLIKYITKFDIRKDSLARIDELFRKVKSAEEKYMAFYQEIKGVERSLTLDQASNNISNRSKTNALKELFHFKNPSKNEKIQKMGKNTLFNYKFSVNHKFQSERASGPTKNMQETSKTLQGQNIQAFEQVLKTLTKPNQDTESLQSLFASKARINQNNEHSLNFTTIWDKDYYFSYIHFPVPSTAFNTFLTPFQKSTDINYEIYSEDEYHDLLGQDVQDDGQESEISEVSKNSFVVSDNYFSDDQDQEPKEEMKPQKNFGFGERWSFQKGDEKTGRMNFNINSYAMVLIQPQAKLPLSTKEMDQMDSFLYNIVDGKDKESIMQAISKEKIKISKPKINQFLKKNCRTIPDPKNPTKTIYKIIEFENKTTHQNENDAQNCEQITEVEEKYDENQTDLQGHKYFSQSCQRRGYPRRSDRSANSQVSQKQRQKKYVRHPENHRQTRSRTAHNEMSQTDC